MKTANFRNSLLVLCGLVFAFGTNVFAQQDATKLTESVIQTTDKIADLRIQIQEIEVKKATLQDRITQIDDAMLPENLERTTTTAGSTRPEELRENRRRQLETEKKGVQSQIDLLEQSRSRLELSIATAQPKPATAEPTSTKTQTTESAAQTVNQNTATTESDAAVVPPAKPAKRLPAKSKRKRIVKTY